MFAIKSGGGNTASGKATHAPAPHPAVQAARAAAEYASAQVSHMAAQHAANVVAHVAATHHSGHVGAAHVAAHTPDIHSFVHHQLDPFHGISPALKQALIMAAQMQQPQGPSMWNGSQWVPAPTPGNNGVQPQPAPPGQPYSPTGNDSIASNGGGNGILGFLMGLA